MGGYRGVRFSVSDFFRIAAPNVKFYYQNGFCAKLFFKFNVQLNDVKISYHCISCKKEFNDMKSASDHVRSTNHEIIEEKRGDWI